ncbi:MAG TPA: transposase [Thermoanaerobaculia bacterium]|jgi:REP element-mobilizing transposase RayT|nr:transposase [Thermoanaerobaculia bacterium]
MARPLRFIPEDGALVEVVTRTLQSRLLLTPKPLLNRIIIGALARASRRYGVQVVVMAFLSNHYHLVAWIEDARQLARFMTFFNSKLAREIGRLTGWKQKVWSRRYQAIVISPEEEAQVGRLSYVLSHGVKEGLVARVEDWPGVHAASALLSGLPLEGVWYDRTKEYLSKLKGKKTDPARFAEPETLTLAPLPCWKHLSPEAYRARIATLIQQIEEDAAAQRQANGRLPLGADTIQRQDPRTEPNRTKKSPAPRFHAVRKWVRLELYQTYTLFVQAYREAAELLRLGNRNAPFPRGCFPPPLPFVG